MYVSFEEMSILVFCSFVDWVVCFDTEQLKLVNNSNEITNAFFIELEQNIFKLHGDIKDPK